MPNIKSNSDLRNYSDVLRDVSAGAPAFLTKKGRRRYAIIDIQDYEKTRATLKLMGKLAKGNIVSLKCNDNQYHPSNGWFAQRL